MSEADDYLKLYGFNVAPLLFYFLTFREKIRKDTISVNIHEQLHFQPLQKPSTHSHWNKEEFEKKRIGPMIAFQNSKSSSHDQCIGVW